jgi:RHS repeat-associated protein
MNPFKNSATQQLFRLFLNPHYFIYLLLLIPFSVISQPINNFTKGVSVVNPNAASLGKYTDIPISLSTGVPNISIPIHTINEGSLSLPISLNYHASGIKVNEVASWVGSGWTLMAGGSISRTILGLPDDEPANNSGFFYNTFRDKSGLGSTSGLTQTELENVRDGTLDTEADLFAFNFNGNSGKFFFDLQGKIQTIPKQDLKILYHTISHPIGSGVETIDKFNKDLIMGFTFILPDGTKYVFDQVETSQHAASSFFGITFHLTKICSYDGINEIYINYSNQSVNTSILYNVRNLAIAQRIFSASSAITQHLGSVCSAVPTPDRFSQIVNGFFTNVETVKEFVPVAITTKSGNTTIDFVQSGINYTNLSPINGAFARKQEGGREDVEYILPSTVNNDEYSAPYLAQIEIKEGSFCQRKQLLYNYFKDARTAFQNIPWAKRLRLEGLKIIEKTDCSSGSSITEIGAYKLNYFGDIVDANGIVTTRAPMVHRLSRATDHWGYYNGKSQNDATANGNLADLNIPPTTIGLFTYGSSDRSSDEETMKQGALNKIYYPTGGSTAFEYEANKVNTATTDNIVCLDGDNNNSLTQRLFTVSSFSGNLGTLKLEKTTPTVMCTITVFNGSTQLWTTTESYTWLANETKKTLAVTFPSTLPLNTNLKITLQTNSAAIFCIYNSQTSTESTIGGLRIKKTIFRPQNNDDNKIETNYQYTLNDGTSSGVLLTGIPVYGFFNTMNGIATAPGNPIPPNYFTPIVVMQSIPTSPLGNYDGYHVAYKQVTVSQTNNGKKVYYYEAEVENTDKSFPVVPYQFRKNNGQLNIDEVYKKDGNTDILIGSNTYTPKSDELLNGANYSFKVVTINASPQSSLDNPAVWPTPTCVFGGQVTPNPCNRAVCGNLTSSQLRNSALLGILYQKYKIKTSVYRLKNVTNVIDGVSTSTDYTYYSQSDRPLFPVTTTTTNSDGKQQKTTNKYVHEYAGNELAVSGSIDVLVSGNVRTWMLANNLIAIPIEVKSEYNNIVIGGSRTVFGFTTAMGQYTGSTASSGVYPFKYYAYEPLTSTFESNWQLKGSIDKYDLTVGLPKDFLTKGYTVSEMYSWFSNKVLQKRAIGGLDWNYTYFPNTKLLSSVLNENKIKTEFKYDNLMRLTEMKYKDENGVNTKATTTNSYNLGGTTSPTNNYVGTTTTFSDYTPTQSTKQYFDGLGRPISTVRESYTPNYYHQKNNITYDAIGRTDRAYQPFESSTLGYEFIASTVPLSDKPYMSTVYEASPLSRPIKKIMEDGNFVKMEYGTNDATNYLVKLFNVTAGTNGNYYTLSPVTTNNGLYPINTLYRVTSWDENASTAEPKKGRTDVFKDKIGRTILTRKFVKVGANFNDVDTYNIYDDYSNLIAVIPPDVLTTTGISAYSLVFQYKYDNQNRLCFKWIPGADPQELYYDNRDLVVLTQDGKQKVESKFLATLYDAIGRPVKTGFVPTTTVGTTRTNVEAYITAYSGIPATAIAATDVLTETSYVLNKSLVAQTKAKVLGTKLSTDADYITTNFEYDTYGRMNATTGNSHTNQYTSMYFPQNSADKPYSNFHSWVGPDNQYKVTLQYNYYDNGLRPTTTQHRIILDNTWANSTPNRTVSFLKYDYKDRVIEKNLGYVYDWWTGSTKSLQSIDYEYNNRNWLTKINNGHLPQATWYALFQPLISCADPYVWCFAYGTWNYDPAITAGDNNPDLFAMELRYDNPNLALPSSQVAQKNGNISQMVWQVAGREKQAYSFAYDELDRLLEANYTDINTQGNWCGSMPLYTNDNKYKEKIVYEDSRGNINKIMRNGLISNAMWPVGSGAMCGNFGPIDDLSFTYQTNNKNRVKNISDAVTIPIDPLVKHGFEAKTNAVDYEYDENGNLKKDDHKGITSIEYNYLNLPTKITFTNNRSIEFNYDATGKKWRKTVKNGSLTDVRDYIDGVEFKSYLENGILKMKPDKIHFTEGYAEYDASTLTNYSWQGWVYKYTLKDHLGNTRVTFSDKNDDGVVSCTTTDIEQVNHHYPFGLNMEGPWSGATGPNKYQYNGKEWNDEFGLGWNDYGKRWYDPSIGRFNSVDALSFEFPHYTPYQYAGNEVTTSIDLDGLEPVKVKDLGYGGLFTNDAIQRNEVHSNQGDVLATQRYGDMYWYNSNYTHRWTSGMPNWVDIGATNARLGQETTDALKIGFYCMLAAPFAVEAAGSIGLSIRSFTTAKKINDGLADTYSQLMMSGNDWRNLNLGSIAANIWFNDYIAGAVSANTEISLKTLSSLDISAIIKNGDKNKIGILQRIIDTGASTLGNLWGADLTEKFIARGAKPGLKYLNLQNKGNSSFLGNFIGNQYTNGIGLLSGSFYEDMNKD